MKNHPVYDIRHFKQEFRKTDLYVNTFKNHLTTHSFVEKPHRHNFYLLVLFTNGSGVHEIDFDRYDIQKGSLFMLQPGQIHHWNLSHDSDGYIVFYSQEIYNTYFGTKKIEDYPFYESVKSKPHLLLNETELKEISTYFNIMVNESANTLLKSNDKIINLLDTVHIEISRKYTAETNHIIHHYNHKIRQFENLLEKYYHTQKSPSFYASEMNMTLKHLNRICKNILGETVTAIITQRVILESKRLLIDKNKSISQIADALGYENYSYFGKLFKKQTGISPGEFRNSP